MSDRELHEEDDHLNRGVKPPVDQWTRAVPLTPQELAMYRVKQVEWGNELGRSPDVYTCDDCASAPRCKLAFDAYNDEGDCLLEK
jgi:hypothetical protein